MILRALRDHGLDSDALTVDALAPIDQFHHGGRRATAQLARLAGLEPGMRVLDVGGGIGGPARTLAHEFGCRVTVLDLSEAFCRVGEMLTARTGLGDVVRFRHGSALEMRFDDGAFDAVWSQHSAMNIADKERLYREARRVLRPGGLLAIHDVMAGPAGPPDYPLPWAADPAISFLRAPEEVRALLAGLGFTERLWDDITAPAAELLRRTGPQAGPPNIFIVMRGPEAGARVLDNFRRGLDEGRLAVIQAVYERT